MALQFGGTFWFTALIIAGVSTSVIVMWLNENPWFPAMITAIAGAIYAYFLELYTSFSLLIVDPAWRIIEGTQEADLYGIGCVAILIAMIWVGLVALANLINTWGTGKPTLWQ